MDFLIYPIYRSPNSSIDLAIHELNDVILYKSNLKTANYKILVRDLNIDLLKPTKIKEEYLLILAQFNFPPLIKNISRPASKIYIDHILLETKSFANIKPIIIHSNITDHYPIVPSVSNILDNHNNNTNSLKISSLNNFRPISVISNIAKIVEKIIKSKLTFYLETNSLLLKNQFGFRPNKSNDHAIAHVTKQIYTALDEGKHLQQYT